MKQGLLIVMSLLFASTVDALLPKGFVYVDEQIPSIVQNLRYATSDNFVGRPIKGYLGKRAILTDEAVEALKTVQNHLLNDGYTLVIYDAYRPQKASDDFVSWTHESSESMKAFYYPNLEKIQLFTRGYIAAQSAHSRGSTVDVTYMPINETLKSIVVKSKMLISGKNIPFLDDNSVDMGTSFDFFGSASAYDSDLVDQTILDRRNYLRKLMVNSGFKAKDNEWWHYTLLDEPYPTSYFDFDVN